MSQLSINALHFNNGIHLLGQAPLDDRTVWTSIEDIYVDGDNPTEAPMYYKAFTGMHITIIETDEITGKSTATIMALNDATPYTPGETITVNADNYTDYWTVVGNDVYDKIEDSLYFHGGDADVSTATLNPHGNLRKGITIGELETMTTSEILKAILFEVAEAVKQTELSVSCSFSNYSTVQEVGAAMPTASNISVTFQSETYKCISSGGEVVGSYTLSKLNSSTTVKYYNGTSTSVSGGTNMSSSSYTSTYPYVEEGSHNFYVDVHYDAYQNALNSDGTVKAAAVSGSEKTDPITMTGVYRIFSNAWKTYTDASTAYANRGDESTTWNESTKTAGSLMNGTVTQYYKWPSDITSEQEFHIYVPVGHEITSIKAANNTSKDTYDLDATATKQTDTVNISTTNSRRTGEYDDYIVTRSSGNTNVMVVIK